MDLESKRTEIINRMLMTSGKDISGENAPANDVAIIGLSGYFPQSMDIQQFWDALDNDRSLIGEIPNSRIDWNKLYDPNGKDPNKSNSRRGGIIPDIRNFDPEFFGILPGEAALMDPRKRLLLMSVYHAIEDAGYAPGSFKKSNAGVFIAVEEDEYNQCMRESGIDVKAGSGYSSSLMANQISWFFDLRGPSEVINTMCSGGAVAIHQAVNAIKTGKIPIAIVGAANLLLHADPFIFLSRTGQISPDDSVRSFGKDARGFLRADGVASVILKSLPAAVADGDAIYAVIKNSAVNYNGRGGTSMAMPNIPSHTSLIRTCYTEAGIDPRRISYIEAQGMGNPVADIAEWEACNQALESMAKEKEVSLEKGSCRISTLKPMLGHMHAASALGALFKIIRSFQTNKIHKIIGLDVINPDLDIRDRPCRLITATEDWPKETNGRLAGLHSYGSGGNNAHILLEEYKPRSIPSADYPSSPLILPFSANTEGQCKKIVQQLLDFIVRHPVYTISSIAYTLQTGRDAMKYRIAFMAATREEFIKKAGAYLQGNTLLDKPPAAVEAWVKGNSITWDKTTFGHPVQRLHLPVYPFDCRQYWLDTPDIIHNNGHHLEEAEAIVRELLNTFLLNGTGNIDLDTPFSDLGFDSLLVMKLSHGLNQNYGLMIEPAIFFGLTTPGQLSQHISGVMAAKNNRQPAQDIATKDAIAIVGVSGSFPQSPTPDILWQNLVNGNHCIEEIPEDRWSVSQHFHPDKETAGRTGKSYGKWGGFIKDFYHFDPLFFKISPAEAELMSPKERLFLQCAWNVLEDAGYTPPALAGEQVGVFAGVTRGGIDPYKTSPFTVSNRVSFVLDLNGPSMTIDTACSSSLVAIHEACRHIHSGECSMALAGGVHVFLDPSHFAALSGMYMLSPDGLSKSFGNEANGMVPGEGVGIVLLKPLERAVADKDIIYGVIKGSAVNHGGRTNGFSVPDPVAQQHLIEDALRKAGVHARDVSYVEAHGTGTPLGDPIEIRGLTEAFKKDSSDTGYCRIGSVKSNIGHLEAAAGISGLIKILLQMKHGQLVPSLHSRELNPQIDFPKTPFIVQQELENWIPKDKNGKRIARIACVSSFGAGGTNAHLVVEEYRQEEVQKEPSSFNINNGTPVIILLSAKNKDRLQEIARQLLGFLQSPAGRDGLSLADLAYTLRIGRVTLEEKLAIEAASLKDLEIKLTDFLTGKTDIDTPFDWTRRYEEGPQNGHRQPHRIPVPGYPFMKEYFGLPRIVTERTSVPSVLHPLVHMNTSTFQEQKFSTLFTGEEFFLKDHVVMGEKFLPGAAYLEMAAAAMKMAAAAMKVVAAATETAAMNGEQDHSSEVTVQLRNIGWIEPIAVGDKPAIIHIGFYKGIDGNQNFEIYSAPGRQPSGNRIHCQGSTWLKESIETPATDIDAIRNTPGLTIYTQTACYEIFAAAGVIYGAAHRPIEQLYAGQQLILAQLRLPAVVSHTLDQFRLHPSLLDGAFQSIMGFMLPYRGKYKDEMPLMIPFALEELTIFHPCTSAMWALIRMNGHIGPAGNWSDFDSLSFDIDLMDEKGTVCIRMNRFTARMLKKKTGERDECPAPSEDAGDWTIDLQNISHKTDGIKEKSILYLKKILSAAIRLPVDRIGSTTPFDQYGIDSIMVMKMTAELEKVFGSLPKTLFFEYQHISELTDYFIEAHAEKLNTTLGFAGKKQHFFSIAPGSEKKEGSPDKEGAPDKEDSPDKEKAPDKEGPQDIAIIGLSGRYPQARNIQEFWDNLRNGRNSITEIPEDRWDHSLYFDEDKNKPSKTYSKWGGFLDGVDEFDPLFFNISPREAELLDPQERLFLQCVHEAIEDAGYTRQLLGNITGQGKIGVYAGVMWNEYQLYAAQETVLGRPLALSSSPSSIANRISYFYNFNGPSLAIDTMCSSSLTAIHLACQSLRHGDCEVAIAGGVNVTIHPNKYLVLGYGKVASSKGRCESFGKNGDGYVPSEGVGAVLLKPLSKAISHRDHIYGVIKGTAINHGGKVNGYTVPNPRAQAKVIGQALERSGFDPRTISYVEAHGTGTALGDPIEIAGLSAGFNSPDRHFCAIGSAKSNIGHCESAAGIAGVTKVLLQMQHRQIVPSLHSQELNPDIDFENSPFVVQQELTEWPRPVLALNGKISEYPRRAGVSSFGAGGSNAHIIIEEYTPDDTHDNGDLPVPGTQGIPVAILLSAKSEDRLKQQATQLLAAVQNGRYEDKDLVDMAYTLQTGRESLEDRLAIEVTSIRELEEKLGSFIKGREWIENVYAGKTGSHRKILDFFLSDDDMEKTIESWLTKRKFTQLLGLWVNGLDVDWEKLYAGPSPAYSLPKRISLPSYPFLRDRYWPVIGNSKPAAGYGPDVIPILHPLVHRNTSTLAGQRYSSTFHGNEFFLKDHVVNGDKVLPGMAHVEMAIAAMSMATGQNSTGFQLKNMAWEQLIKVNGGPEKVDIGLTPFGDGKIGFSIQSQPGTDGILPIKYSHGIVSKITKQDFFITDIDALKSQLNGHMLSTEKCYGLFSKMGIVYGPAYRCIDAIYIGEQQVLAKLTLPKGVASTLDQYYLHPSLMDASLQAVAGLLAGRYADMPEIPLAIPFAIRSLTVADRCRPEMWANIRFSAGKENAVERQDAGQLSFDIDLLDETGKLCTQIQGFTARILRKKVRSLKDQDILMIEPFWQRKEIVRSGKAVPPAQHLIIVIENNQLAGALSSQLHDATVVRLQDSGLSSAENFGNYAIRVFKEVKQLLASRPKNNILVQVIVPENSEKHVFLAISGLLKTAGLENPVFAGQIIGLESEELMPLAVERIIEDSKTPSDTIIRYRSGCRETFCLREYSPGNDPAIPIWKDKDVYLITGGAGGLGLIFANEIALQTKDATVILTGRSPLNEQRKTHLNTISSLGLRVEYRQADVTDERDIEVLIQNILQEFGRLNGIIHSAGVIRDNFILRKSEEEIREVFAPKVKGLLNLDFATRNISLDFFIVCSSGTGITGNTGQADYAMANAYMDRYAEYRNTLVKGRKRSGKTLSVNWPLWREGGMQIAKENERLLREDLGMIPMETAAGLNALYTAIAAGAHQMMITQGELPKLRSVFLGFAHDREQARESQKEKSAKGTPEIARTDRSDQQQALDFFRKILSATLKLPGDLIHPDKPMAEYGIDSVMVMQMTNELETSFGSLPKTLFFEYPTINELMGYFQENFPEKFDLLSEVRNEPVKNEVPTDPAAPKEVHPGALDIAIIGLSGSYPQARDLEGFWEILKDGRNCITEIPVDRWDHSKYFDKNKDQPGKTYGKWGGFLDGVDQFDPLFFKITPREAAIMDPQERLFLQCVYQTMEDAGYARGTIPDTGVFVGVMSEEYQLYGSQETALGRPLVLSGNSASIANRVSYFFNCSGPSIALNTMCSSSLTAIHLACQSLRLGECTMAVAGGVNTNIHPNKYMGLAYGKFLSGKGLCESFGAGGDGYVPGEGVGAVLLKPLAAALSDNDHIYGVIKGTGVNHGGKANGYTVPNPAAQGKVIEKAIKMAGFPPRTISYLEAHGTGTSLGDPIEIAGLMQAFDTKDRQFCPIGSVKTNIGHCESAAGIAGITKVLLQMKHGQLVPSLHAEELNPNIDFSNSPFFVQRELTDWKRPCLHLEQGDIEFPRRAGISSFGAGGANAHILIEEYIPDSNSQANERLPVRISPREPAIIVLHAGNSAKLKQQAEKLEKWIKDHREQDIHRLADLAYTLQTGREVMEQRLTIEAQSFSQLESRLAAFTAGAEGIEGIYTEKIEEGAPSAWKKPGQQSDGRTYRPKRISLPTYPFEKRRCWFEQPVEVMKEGIFLKKQWDPAQPVASRTSCNHVAILYSTATKELAIGLTARLPGSILIAIHDENAFHPDRLQKYEWSKFDGFIDLIGCSRDPNGSLEWLQWLQHLIEYGDGRETCILGITEGLSAFQNDSINLTGAWRAGLYQMLSSEYSHIVSRQVDIEENTLTEIAIDQILEELSIRDGQPEVCYRNGIRYRTFLQETSAESPARERLLFSGQQVLWITGGTRGLGYLCARHFVKEYGVKRLVLTGLEPLPPREEWSAYKNLHSPLAHKIKNFLALEDMGAAIKVLSVPLTDKSALQKELLKIKQEWGGVHAIIHCAGLIDHKNPAFIRKSLSEIQKVLDPKVKGLDNLYQCFRKEPLEFFLLFSSVSAVIPSLSAGQAAYGMANTYMDYFASSGANSDKYPIISIQWPGWKETGMGEVRSNAYHLSGLLTLTDAEGLRLLDRIIHEQPGRVILPARIDQDKWKPEELLKYGPRTGRIANHQTPAGKAADHTPATTAQDTLEWLTGLFAKELRLEAEELKPDRSFQDYGIDSILIMQLLHPIQHILGRDIDPSVLFEYATLRSFAAWLEEKLPDALARVLPGKTQDQTIKSTPPAKTDSRIADDIAVVGMTCRFAGANDLDAYWDLLKEGRSAIQTVPPERWNSENNYTAGLIENPYSFDSKFFCLDENDARAMDPQALLILEETLKLFCDAGYTMEEVKGKPIGVYVGGRSNHIPDAEKMQLSRNPILTVGQNYLSANISRFFDLRGPSIVVDTACSSALVAMSMAIQALQNKDTEAAVVGGVSLLITDDTHRLFAQRGLLNKSGDFHILDSRANGIILGEGAGLVLLKTVGQALKDRDHIYAVIKSIAINNDGRTAGPATPNIEAQTEIMRSALVKCNKRPEDISYIEVNGSGSEVPDLIEIKAINAAYRSSNVTPCQLGSTKPNIGHPLCAEGMAGFIKVVKMLHDRKIVPSLSGHQPMKFFNMSASPFSFSKALIPWPDVPAVAAINCFADGGTNAHVIVEAWQYSNTGEHPGRNRKALPVPVLNLLNLREKKAGFTAVNEEQSIWDTFK